MTEMIVFIATLPFNAIRTSLTVARDRSLVIGRELRRRCALHHQEKGPPLLECSCVLCRGGRGGELGQGRTRRTIGDVERT